jgi:hypothetical protein
MLESFEASFTDGTEAEDGGKRMSLKRHRFTAKSEEKYSRAVILSTRR